MSLREDEQQEFSASEEGLANRPTLLGEIHLDFIWTWLLTSCDKKNGNFYWQKVWATFWVWAFIMMNDLTEYTENWLSGFFPAFYCQVKRQYKNLKVVAGEYFPCQKILIDHRSRSSPLTGRKCLSPTDCDTPHSLSLTSSPSLITSGRLEVVWTRRRSRARLAITGTLHRTRDFSLFSSLSSSFSSGG